MDSYFGVLYTNVIISFIVIFIIQFNFVKYFYNYLLKSTDKIKIKQLTIIALFLVLSYNVIFFNTYNQSNFLTVMLINTTLIVVYSIIIFKMIKNNNNYLDISSKYGTALDALKEYEKMLDQYKVCNHENKNQLLVIKGMTNKNNKKLLKYLDDITNTGFNDDEEWFLKLRKIPIGGLKGLFYYKILSMKEKNINVSFHISRDIKKEEFTGLSEETNAVICKIMGVFLDNAIDAVTKLKEKNISLEIYKENDYIIICVANNYEGTIDFSKLGQKGFSTKGSNR
jgi:two-component system sensor histidine kinase AgrC